VNPAQTPALHDLDDYVSLNLDLKLTIICPMIVDRQLDLVAAATVRCQKLLDRIPHLAWLMGDDGEILTVNQQWCDYIGVGKAAPTEQEECPWVFAEILHVDEQESFLRSWQEARSLQTALNVKIQLQSCQGNWEWFQLELDPDGDELERTTWIGTAIKLGGAAAVPGRQQSPQFLEALLANASDGIVACDADGHLVLFNRATQEFHGLPPEPIEPEDWAEYYDLYDRDGIGTLTKSEIPLFRALQGESVISQEMMIRSKRGGDRSVLASGTAIYSPTGEKLGAVVLMRDITDYKRAMTVLQDSEQKFRAIFDGAFQFIGLIKPDGTLIEANLTALKFGGIEAEDAIDRLFWEVPGWNFAPAVRDNLREWTALAAGGEFIRHEVEIVGADNRSIILDFSLTPIRNDRGEVILIIPEGRDITQLKQAEIERIRAQLYSERLSISMRVAKAGAWNWDLRTQQIFWTPEFESLFDYELGTTQQVYREWLARLHPDDRDRVETSLQNASEGKLPEYRCEYRIVLRDGQIRWIDAVGELHSDAQGEPRLMSGLVYDITERKQNEEALRRSEEFTRRVLESNQDCIKVLDLEGRLIYMNDGGQLLMEIDNFDTVANTKWVEFWQETATEDPANAFTTAKAGGVAKFEGYCNTAKGRSKYWDVVMTPILDGDGKVDRILSVARDITERKQAEIALQSSEELFRHTFEQIPLGFAHVALDGSLLRVNQKFGEIVGYTQTELLATTFQAITEPADLAEDLALLAQLVNGEIGEYTLEKRYIHKQGHHVWVNLTVALIRSIAPAGQLGIPQYFLGAIEDITDRKQLELLNETQTADLQRLNNSLILAQQQLQERNQELDRFVSIAAHDLKAPLRAISNLSEWIEEDLQAQIPGENPQLKLLRQRVKRMDALIDGLLRYSRAGKAELATETVDVAEILAETIDSLSPPASFEIRIVNSMPILQTKRLLLNQVFANLISNAIKHHDRPNGRIEITVEDLGDRHQFSIADDGPGIPEGESRERIFEIFQTLNPTTDSTENTGIGLALVKKIVEGEGGKIWLEEECIKGCRFYFTWLKTEIRLHAEI
jgi:PAS domain S-box-containing protein